VLKLFKKFLFGNFLDIQGSKLNNKTHLGIIWYLAQLGGHLVKVLADVPVPAPVQLRLVLDQAQPQVVGSEQSIQLFHSNKCFCAPLCSATLVEAQIGVNEVFNKEIKWGPCHFR
jgi:hypothetical protein